MELKQIAIAGGVLIGVVMLLRSGSGGGTNSAAITAQSAAAAGATNAENAKTLADYSLNQAAIASNNRVALLQYAAARADSSAQLMSNILANGANMTLGLSAISAQRAQNLNDNSFALADSVNRHATDLAGTALTTSAATIQTNIMANRDIRINRKQVNGQVQMNADTWDAKKSIAETQADSAMISGIISTVAQVVGGVMTGGASTAVSAAAGAM